MKCKMEMFAVATVLVAFAALAEPSCCTLGEAKFMSWAPRDRPWTLKGGLLHLGANRDAETSFVFNRKNDARFLAAFASGPAWRVAFKYRSTVKATLVGVATTMERPKAPVRSEKTLPVSAEWREFSWDMPAPQQDCVRIALKLTCAKGDGFVEMKDMSIVDVAPEDKSGKPLLVNGAKVTEVCLYKPDTPRRRENDIRAALMFRFALRAAGGEWLPVKEVEKADEVGANAVLVGRLAVDAGVVAAEAQAKVEGLTGGWATAAKGSRLGLAGAVPSGVQRGAWRVLERLGIVYLGSDMFKPFSGNAFATGDFAEAVLPGTAFSLPGDGWRSGLNAELRGLTQEDCVFGGLAIGSVPECYHLIIDSLGFIVPVSEFRDSHPEYFALQSDGTRLTDDAHARNLAHYCWTAPGLAELIAGRYIEMMRAIPEANLWPLMPGDFKGFNCKCERCKSLGSDSDCLVRLGNRVAELTSREFPENAVVIFSYLDTPEPPKNPVKAHKNLNVAYCVIPEGHWPSCMVIPHPMNSKGVKALADWRRECCPDLSLVNYSSQCSESMNFWPGFDANVWLTRDFSAHGSLMTYRFRMYPAHDYIGDASSFVDLTIYVMARLEVDPSMDERRLVYEFIDLYYGAAAKPMREYFDIATAEPRRRDWVQNCELRLKGFVTKEFAGKAFALLDEAERLAANDAALLVRVRKQAIPFYWSYLDSIGRGRGNVSAAEFKPWAHRVAHFAEMCRENGTYYMGHMGNVTPKQWFRENMMFEIGKDGLDVNWLKDAKIRELIADPEKTLGGDFPNLQRKTADGWEIPAEGMKGGEFLKKDFWRRENGGSSRVVRRESSSSGLVFTRFDLDSAPRGPAKMIVTGIDNEKEPIAEIEVKVNSQVVYAGSVRWGKDAHSEWTIELPPGLLKKGGNEIQLRNTTPDAKAAQDGECGDALSAARNYYWGWFILDKVALVVAD